MLKDITTKAEYEDYQTRFRLFMEREGINCLSRIDWEADDYFSMKPCQVCERQQGGNRVDCNGYNPTTKGVCGPYSVCLDCHYYAEYGQLDDMTMMDMKDDDQEA